MAYKDGKWVDDGSFTGLQGRSSADNIGRSNVMYNPQGSVGLAASVVPPSQPVWSYKPLEDTGDLLTKTKVDNAPPGTTQGPSETMANLQVAGNIGLGLLSYLDNKKTSKLQRQGMRQDIAAAAEHNQMKRDNRAAWNSAFSNQPPRT